MTNNDIEWNRWRGTQTQVLKDVKEELHEINNRLRTLEEGFWIIKGKSIAYGSISGIIIVIVSAIIGIFT